MKYIVTLLLFLFSCTFVLGQRTSNKNNETKLKHTSQTTRPSKPSSAEILCSYEDGILLFTSETEILPMDVTISDSNGFERSFVVYSPELEVDLTPSIYYICCHTATHGVFAGYLDLTY